MLHPNSLFHLYREKIAGLCSVEKDSILNDSFELYCDKDLEIYYAPHNEYIEAKAKILIVGITPGWSQTQRAYETAKVGIAHDMTDEQVCCLCKKASRFVGTMRDNLISMLDSAGLHEHLELQSCCSLFDEENTLMHTTSLVKYPVFYRGKNYSGHAPAIATTKIIIQHIDTGFIEELKCLSDIRLIIPLGTAVENILRGSQIYPFLQGCEVLWGFPHPSGLNARRNERFRANYEDITSILKRCDFR